MKQPCDIFQYCAESSVGTSTKFSAVHFSGNQ